MLPTLYKVWEAWTRPAALCVHVGHVLDTDLCPTNADTVRAVSKTNPLCFGFGHGPDTDRARYEHGRAR